MANGHRGTPRSTIREVAELAGVALSSVSRVLSNHPDVSPGMRTKVMAAVDRLGYQPDMLAQSMRRRSTMSAGFVVSDISNPLLADIAMGAETALRAAGYSMLLTNSENDPSLDASHVRLLQQRRVDGLLLSLAAEDNLETIDALRSLEAPVVLIDRDLPATVAASAVLSDHRSGMKDAVSHLLELGHRRIGLILGQPLRFSRERLVGLQEAYAERGLDPTYSVVEGRLGSEHGREATRRLLDEDPAATAIIAGGNQLLVGTLEELRDRRLKVGRDISLVSCDAISVTELFDPPIAVIRRDNREIGRRGAELLLQHLRDEDLEPQQVVLPTEFVARASCAPPAAPKKKKAAARKAPARRAGTAS
jgi:LacI family transcriptional regulator